MGLPVAGKSTIARQLVAAGYTRFNRDDLRSRWQIQFGARVRF